MIFAARQIQEKCREQHRDLCMTFIDLTKAFDSVHREGLWKVLKKIGCPDKFVSIVRSFHDGMMGCVLDDGEISSPFDISHGTKQGCVLAPLLFSIFFAMMLPQGLRPRRVYAVQNGWQRLQPSSSPGKDEGVLCHPS